MHAEWRKDFLGIYFEQNFRGSVSLAKLQRKFSAELKKSLPRIFLVAKYENFKKERYQVKFDASSDIENNPNDFCEEIGEKNIF